MSQVLLIGKDWRARALLRAQLIEEGLDVEARETASDAAESLERTELLPSLIVADLAASEDPSADVDQLARWAKQTPTWIIASHGVIVDKRLNQRGFEVILFRPVDVGELVDQIKWRVER
jgi:CheY-like chemotaxis protein